MKRTKAFLPFASAACACAFALLASCASNTAHVQRGAKVKSTSRWAILPFQNHSETPQAGERVEALVSTVLRSRGIGSLDMYPPAKGDEHLVADDRQRLAVALDWAKAQKFEYALEGSVEEWRYKSGLDGEPAVGVTLRIVDLRTGRVVWSGSAARTGVSSDNASGTALKVVDSLVSQIDVEH